MIPFPSIEQRCIEAALEFANLRTTTSAEVVQALFQPVAMLSQVGKRPVFQTLPESDAGAFDDNKRELVGWLEVMSRWSRAKAKDRSRVHAEIQTKLGRTVGGSVQWVLSNGALHVLVQPELRGVEACYSFAAAMLADENEKRWRRLGRCSLSSCGSWFWERTVRAGPVRQFCSDAHAAAARKARFKRHK